MSRPASRSSRPDSPRNPIRIAALVLLLLATGISLWLAMVSGGNQGVPGCDGGDCGAVLTSRWAKAFGIPVGWFGAAAYFVLATLGFKPLAPEARGARIAASTLVLLIPVAALWFAFLQLFVLKAFCPWCTLTHALATTGAILMAVAWKKDPTQVRGGARRTGGSARTAVAGVWAISTAVAGVAFAGMLIGQWLGPEPPKSSIVTASMGGNSQSTATSAVPASSNAITPPQPETSADRKPAPPTETPVESPASSATASPPEPSRRILNLHQGRFLLDPADYPIEGHVEAEHWVVMISDYTCRYCRSAHKVLEEVRQAFGERDLGFIMLPSHHGGDSKVIQELMLAAWKTDPAVWQAVADDLYSERIALQPGVVRRILSERLGSGRLEAALGDHALWTTNLFQLSRDLSAANREVTGRGSIPQFIMGNEIIVGTPADAAEVFGLLEKHLGLKRDRFPELELLVSELDLGRIFAGTQQRLTIPYINAGQAALRVSRAVFPQGGRALRGLHAQIPPGQTSFVELAMTVPPAEGPFDQWVTLHSNSRTSTTPVRVRGTTWKPLRVTPEALDFGRLEPGQTATQAVMRVELLEPAEIEAARSQNTAFSADLREIEAGRLYEVTVNTSPSMPNGLQQSAIVLSLKKPKPEGWPESLAFAARAVVERVVTVAPPQVVLPAGMLTAERHYQFRVRCLDSSHDFVVHEAVLENGPAGVQIGIESAGGPGSFVVRMTLPAGWLMPAPPLTPRLVIKTSHPSAKTVVVPFLIQGG